MSRRTYAQTRGRVPVGVGGGPLLPIGTLNAVAQAATTDFVGTFTSNLPLQPLTIAPNPTLFQKWQVDNYALLRLPTTLV